jgi:hypothetical protein
MEGQVPICDISFTARLLFNYIAVKIFMPSARFIRIVELEGMSLFGWWVHCCVEEVDASCLMMGGSKAGFDPGKCGECHNTTTRYSKIWPLSRLCNSLNPFTSELVEGRQKKPDHISNYLIQHRFRSTARHSSRTFSSWRQQSTRGTGSCRRRGSPRPWPNEREGKSAQNNPPISKN